MSGVYFKGEDYFIYNIYLMCDMQCVAKLTTTFLFGFIHIISLYFE